MAGFSIVMMMFVFVIIFAVVTWAFEIMSVLSIVFSAVSLSKSKNYISRGGMYDYHSVKRFHNTAVVFFVFGCIVAVFTVFGILVILADYFTDSTHSYNNTAPLIAGLISAAKNAVVIIVGIKSFKKFAQAKELYTSLCKTAGLYRSGMYNVQNAYAQNAYAQNAYARNVYGQNTYGQGNYTAPNTPYSDYGNANGFAPPPVYVSGDKSEADNVGVSQDKESVFDEEKTVTAKKIVFNDTVPDKICPKCGCANSGLYKYCTLCGEKLQ